MMVLRYPGLLALFVLCVVATINADTIAEQLTAQNPCVTKPTCSECIQTKSCAWCMQSEFSDRPRCFQPSISSTTGFCNSNDTWNPSNYKYVDPLLNQKLSIASGHSSASGSSGSSSSGSSGSGSSAGASGSIVQIYPQEVQLKLRINQAERVQVSYAQAIDYPVDLYYLMDLSKSMEDDKEKLSKLGSLLSHEMQAITSNFRLGFGSFVDKVVMPYVSTVKANLESPCQDCAAPYGFHNIMQLSENTSRFANEVRNAQVSGNLDAPEGGFDAIMQAIVCQEDIGWRNQSRKLLVFSTDAGFHYAGDGKLGGIVKPNDGECHLENGRVYNHSKIQDYPSISQLNLKVKKNAINVIFAVTAGQIGIYKKLEDHIEGSSSATLSEDSSNVVELVKTEYSKISSSIEMNDDAASKYIKVKYFSRCLNPNGPEIETSKCDGLKVGNTVTFSAEITAKSCPVNRKEWNQKLKIYPIGLTEAMVVNIEMLCDCPCERLTEEGYEPNSPLCSGNGTYSCGICLCKEGYSGRKCECSPNTKSNTTLTCRSANSTKDCSGRGECNCGQCICLPRSNPEEEVWGEHCQCDNFSCERRDNKFCSGNGQCKCGECECNADWSGPACDCRNTTKTCISPAHTDQNIICSNHGECVCGACVCAKDVDGGRYSGKYCERCPGCSGKCDEFKDCVMCQMYKTGQLTQEECATNCTTFNVPESAIVVKADENKGEYLCTYNDENGCRFSYVYSTTTNDTVVVRAQQEPVCPAKVFMLGIVLGVIAAIVLIGLAMILLWKMVTTIHDRREFAKFEKERMMAKWDTGENPIYKQATSTFKNPTYAGK